MGGVGRFVVVVAALVAAFVAPAIAHASPPQHKILGAVPHKHGTGVPGLATPALGGAPSRADAAAIPGALLYHGGPVMHSVTVHTVYWVPATYSVAANYSSLIDGFLTDVSADSGKTSNVFSNNTQYYDGGGHITYSVANDSYLDTDPFPAGVTTVRQSCYAGPPCVTDDELISELRSVIAAKSWPLHTYTNLYVILTPQTVNVCAAGVGGCTTDAFCAYHSWDWDNVQNEVNFLYAVEPYFNAGQLCDDGNFPDGSTNDAPDITINTLSHETNEAITDPTGIGWWDSQGYEIGDKCAYNYGTHLGTTGNGDIFNAADYNQVINGHDYYLQREWSNGLNNCFQVGKPTITSLSSTAAQNGDTVDIYGTNFFSAAGTTPTVLFNGHSAAVNAVTPTDLTVTVPDGNISGHITVQAVGGSVVSTPVFHVLPAVTGLSVLHGFAGTVVTVTGSGFFGVLSVKINGVLGSFNTVALNGTSLHFIVPNAATTGLITVTTAGGSANSGNTFTVDPKVTSFSPLAATAGTTVTISGSGFGGANAVTFDGTSSPTVTAVSANQVKATVPDTAQNGPIVVTTPAGDSAPSVGTFKTVPKIANFNPDVEQVGNTLIINGTNLVNGAGPTVKLGTLPLAVTSATATEIDTDVLPDNALTNILTVTTSGGTASMRLPIRPTIIGDPVPNTGHAGDHIVINGKTFTGTTSVKFGNGTEAAPFTVSGGGTVLHVTVPANATTSYIKVTNAGGSTSTTVFTVLPKITGFTPAAAKAGSLVTITGSGLNGASVDFTGSPGAVIALSTANSIQVNVPNDAQVGPITVHAGGNDATTAASFKPTPTISAGPATQAGYFVNLAGANLTGTTTLKLGTQTLTQGVDYTVVNATRISLTPPPNSKSGFLTVVTPGGTAMSPTQQIVEARVDTPSSSENVHAGDSLVFFGAGFNGVTAVKWTGPTGAQTVAGTFAKLTADGTELRVVAPSGAVTGPVAIYTGTASILTPTMNVWPVVTSISPTSVGVGATLTIYGSGLYNAQSVDFSDGNGGVINQVVTGARSPNSTHVVVPPGARDGMITVHTTESSYNFMGLHVTFSVSHITPSAGTYGQDITFDGVGFTTVTAVKFNGVAGVIKPGRTDTQMVVATPADPGTHPNIWGDVTVWKGLAHITAPTQFKRLDITDFAPTSGVPGTDVTINGHGFTGLSHVYFHGTEASVSSSTDTQIVAKVPQGATTGPISVDVGGITVTTADFTVNTQATVQINEVGPNMIAPPSGPGDLVELKVTGAGHTDGIQLRDPENAIDPILAILPDITVAKNDIIVVHLVPPPGVTNETAGWNDCNDPTCYSNAWDVKGRGGGIQYPVNRVLYVSTKDGDVQDGVAFAYGVPTDAAFQSDLAFLHTIGQWPDCGGVTCTDSTNPSAVSVSVDWWGGGGKMGNDATGESVARTGDADTNTNSDWTLGAESWGQTNP